ncbi:MAG: cysteine desulfurase [Chitinophagales bacterium]|nr:cysteine desulfurase [Chitinophagales bacterium]
MQNNTSDFIYFDHNATTPVDERVLEAMLPFFSKKFANAASITYSMGLDTRAMVDNARNKIAHLLNCIDQEVTFTSGSTEGLNTAIKGIFWRYQIKGKHFISLPTEHQAVLDTLKWIEKQGAEVTYLSVDGNGLIDLQELEKAIRNDTVAVIAMLANNETGVIQPIKKIADIVHNRKSILICDATQAIGKIKVDVQELGIDVLTLSAHKFYGPKGIGALYLRRRNPRVTIDALMHGGGHERGNRSGTLNVPGIIGLGKAADLADEFIATYQTKVLLIRKYIEEEIIKYKIGHINASEAEKIPNTINIRLDYLTAESVIKKIQHQIAVSTGSACSASDPRPSHVLLSMGLNEDEAHHTIRVSLGIENTIEEAQKFIKILKEITDKRELAYTT